jgi:aldehyde:ferredoxin oxidoreductase
MGSKNLKAVVVHGNKAIPVHSQSDSNFLENIMKWREHSKNTAMGKMVDNYGTIGFFLPYHSRGWVPIKNLTTNILHGEEFFEAGYIREKAHRGAPRSCSGCTFRQCRTVEVVRGPYKGVVGEEVEYEILAGFGSNWGICDPGAVTMLNNLNDNLGMDAKETTFLISMIMEGYDKGLIKKSDLDGIDLKWGDVEAAAEMLKKISYRDGFGDILAEGVMRVADKLGGEFPDMAVFVKKGNAPHVHDLRTRWGTLFNQVVSNMGSQEGIDLTSKAYPDLGIEKPTSKPDEYLGEVEAKTSYLRQLEDCLVFCYFQRCPVHRLVETCNCLTGSDYNDKSILNVGRRVVNLLRMFNKREGMTKEEDCFSHRIGLPPVNGPGKNKSLSPTFEKVRDAYYRAMGWGHDGMPTRKTLEELDIEFTMTSFGK